MSVDTREHCHAKSVASVPSRAIARRDIPPTRIRSFGLALARTLLRVYRTHASLVRTALVRSPDSIGATPCRERGKRNTECDKFLHNYTLIFILYTDNKYYIELIIPILQKSAVFSFY